MLDHFNVTWGTGIDGTVFTDHTRTDGPRGRAVGLTKLQLFASYLDPRTKKLKPFLGDGDRATLKQAIRDYIIEVEWEEEQRQQRADPAAQQPAGPAGGVVAAQQRAQVADIMADLDDDDDADNNIDAQAPAFALNRAAVAAIVDAQLVRYDNEKQLKFFENIDDEGNPFGHSNPLVWWRERTVLYPALSKVARMILSIPATSAPCERLFSHAGLTITNDRARLTPDVASDLIFLHDAYPLVMPQFMPPP